MADTFSGKHGMGFVFPFGVTNATWSASNVDLTTPSSAKYVVMPADGSVVGLGVVASENCSAGTATFKVHKFSTEYAGSSPAPVINATNCTASYGSVRPGAITFSAGDTLGISYSSDATFAPTDSCDFTATLYVVLKPT